MRVVVADPPAYTPPYDYALSAALVRQGLDVRLLTSRFRFGAVPPATGFSVDDSLYGLAARLGADRGRLAAKALGHPRALAKLTTARCDVLHLQWVQAPESESWLLHTTRPLVFTAHDLLPRRTARRTRTWKRLFRRFDRIVTHSEHGRRSLEAFGVPAAKLRVIAHPAFRSEPARADDGHTVLALGVIRPYKGLPDAIEAVLGLPEARLLVAGDPRIPLDELRRTAGDRAEWRLGYLNEHEIALALGSATVAVFPYRAELDQSGALLQAIGAGVPAVVYDVGGLGEIVGAFGAGRVVPPGDVKGLRTALGELLEDADALDEARAGAARARENLSWDRAAGEHRALYEELV
jgi:glycosyltransferase involved in cell wall biosynthesis